MRFDRSAIALIAMGLLHTATPVAAFQSPDQKVGSPDRPITGETPAPSVFLPAPVLRSTVLSTRPAAMPLSIERNPMGGAPTSPDQAIDHGDGYYRRLDIHRWGSYAMLPLFAGTYLAGNELLNGSDPAGWVRSAHGVGVTGLGILFGVNTVTGVWNLIESRNDPGAVRRILHSTLMLAADAGFLYTASLAGEREDDDFRSGGFEGDNRKHRDWALGSMGVSLAGTLVMWLWKD